MNHFFIIFTNNSYILINKLWLSPKKSLKMNNYYYDSLFIISMFTFLFVILFAKKFNIKRVSKHCIVNNMNYHNLKNIILELNALI